MPEQIWFWDLEPYEPPVMASHEEGHRRNVETLLESGVRFRVEVHRCKYGRNHVYSQNAALAIREIGYTKVSCTIIHGDDCTCQSGN
jgi:hypothetical protein